MGALADALRRVLPERKVNVGSQIPTWEQGKPQTPKYWHNYYRYALEGYGRSEIVFSCVEELSTSASEPRLVGVRKTTKGTEQVKDHPILDLFDRPNPYMSRYDLIATMWMYRSVGGNAYLYKTRSAAGKVVELWPLRTDRVFVVPDAQTYIKGWEYRLEGQTFLIAPQDIIQWKTRNPLDDWYGMPPLAVCAERVDTDAMMRSFTLAFFRNAAVPAGLLNITKQVTQAERQLIRDKFRNESGGPQNWHQMMVLDNMEASYTPMGLPLGTNGIVLPELDEISEARIGMAFGVPLELIGARLGMVHGNRSTMEAARGSFWDETLSPGYQDLASTLSRGMVDQELVTDIDYLEFDLSTVKALAEDEDAKHTRVRADLAAGVISLQEARVEIGHEPDYEPGAILVINEQLVPQIAETAIEAPVPRPPVADAIPGLGVPPALPAAPNGTPPTNGKAAVDMDALRELAKGSH